MRSPACSRSRPNIAREYLVRCSRPAVAALPIVTTQMPGCSDVVRDGWSGYLVPPRAPCALAEFSIYLKIGRRSSI
jgi:glycosyltransferase involved in cell wall biosynthesis